VEEIKNNPEFAHLARIKNYIIYFKRTIASSIFWSLFVRSIFLKSKAPKYQK